MRDCSDSVNVTFNDERPREIDEITHRQNDEAKRSKDDETVRPPVDLVDVTASTTLETSKTIQRDVTHNTEDCTCLADVSVTLTSCYRNKW